MRWYCANGRHALPWRQTRDPYAILVSEVMLQQTQVERVLPYYEAWLARWPTLESLASASPAEVIRAWAGLGYNRRALNLLRAATTACDESGGRLPQDAARLQMLPGIGPYTAAAIVSFAAEQPIAVVETNIGRLIARAMFGRAALRDVQPSAIASTAGAMLPRSGRAARHHNLALMDLGAILCKPRQPLCGGCPLASSCRWKAASYPPSTSVARPAPRFESTARFARGRIVEMLRVLSPMNESELAAALPAHHAAKAAIYLDALEREGLIERIGDAWALPAAQGRMSIASPKL